MGLRNRVKKLEDRIGGAAPVMLPSSPSLREQILAIEAEIAAREAEMRRSGMSEAEIRATDVEYVLEEELEKVTREIERLEAEED